MSVVADLPDALHGWEEIEQTLRGRRLVLFLDFDGTLAPIVADPATATLPPTARAALEDLVTVCPVVIVSGRDADDVRARVGIEGLVVAGSHGFDVVWPDGRRSQRGHEHLPHLDAATTDLRRALADIPGVEVESKRFAVAVHYRRTPADRHAEVDRHVTRVAEAHPALRCSGGKQVVELRPDLDWDKGTTVLWLLHELELDDDTTMPMYLGDDLTDEDAFTALERRGAGIGMIVRDEDDQRPTAARWSLAGVGATAQLLRRLHGQVTGS